MLDTVVFTDPKAIAFFSDEMVLVKINAAQDTLLREKYGIMGYPTSVLVRTDGTEVDRLIGFAPTEDYLQTFRDFSNGIGTLDYLLARFEASPSRDTAFAIASKYKYRGQTAEGEAWFVKVIEMGAATDSLAGEAQLELGDMYMRAKDYPKALAAMAKARQDFPATRVAETADIFTAVIHQRAGDTAAAVSAFEEFVKNWPDSEDAEYAKNQLEKLTGNKKAE